jgi:hypothetical protein
MRMRTDNDAAESFFLSTDYAFSAPPEPLPWARGEANGDRRELVQSEKCVVLRHGGGTGRCGIAACVARALQKYPGRACMAFLLRPQEVRRVDNTCTQFDPKTLDSLVHYVLQCRRKGKSCDVISSQQNQGKACRIYLLQQAASPCTAHSNTQLNSGQFAGTCLLARLHRAAPRSATPCVRWSTGRG